MGSLVIEWISSPMPKSRHLRNFVYSLPPGDGQNVFCQYQLSERFSYCLHYIAITDMAFPHGQPFLFS